MKRRTLLLSTSAFAALAGFAVRPGERGAPHLPYFQQLSTLLRQHAGGTPVLIIDRQKMLKNAAIIKGHIANKMALRLVSKSLSCLGLLDELMQTMQTRRLMVFNLPQLLQLAKERPDTDLLLGKPLPVAAAAQFYRQIGNQGFVPHQQLQWLIDTPQRLQQYRDLARGLGQRLRVNLEIDVGLHRGGIADLATLHQVLDLLKNEPGLEWSGMMGYDAHVGKLPLSSMRNDALQHVNQVYQQMLQAARSKLGQQALTLNVGGSPTYRLHDGTASANELALGSALLKPGDFDTDLLQDLEPACYIATPVLKAQAQFQMPYGVQGLSAMARAWDVNQRRAWFVYGGNWLADPVSPAGLQASGLYGNSSNQQVLLGSGVQQLQVDDFIFFRPRQSEAVLLQFGAIAVLDQGKLSQFWQPMPAQP
jgi:D-serine deaminase-like pyridoxal phosphate-dependent protein